MGFVGRGGAPACLDISASLRLRGESPLDPSSKSPRGWGSLGAYAQKVPATWGLALCREPEYGRRRYLSTQSKPAAYSMLPFPLWRATCGYGQSGRVRSTTPPVVCAAMILSGAM